MKLTVTEESFIARSAPLGMLLDSDNDSNGGCAIPNAAMGQIVGVHAASRVGLHSQEYEDAPQSVSSTPQT